MKLITTLFLAAASSLVAQAAHHHAHRHQHKRDIVYKTVVSPDTVFVYQLDGEDIPVSEVCDGIKDGKYKWADGTAPAGACTPTSSATSVTAAVFFEVTSSTKSTSTTTSSTTTSSTTTTTPTPTSTSTTHTTSPPPPSTTSKTTTSVAPSTSQQPSTSSGGVTIKNSMGQTIYLWSTSDVAGTMVTLPVGGTYAETWKMNPDLGGISIKVATTPDESDILQYEYTLVGDVIWWDVSLINLELTSLFDKLGFTVTPDTSNCRAVTCPAGNTQCSDAYLYPTDDQATRSCVATTNMVLNLGP